MSFNYSLYARSWPCKVILLLLFLYKNKRRGDLVNVWAMGGVRTRFCAPIHSCVVKNKGINVCLWTDYSRLDIMHHLRYDGTSPSLPVHGVESRWWRQLRDALYVAETCFTRTFPQLRSLPPSCQPREKWCTSQKLIAWISSDYFESLLLPQ